MEDWRAGMEWGSVFTLFSLGGEVLPKLVQNALCMIEMRAL